MEGASLVRACSLPGLQEIAVMSYHDKNDNLKMDTNWIGYPEEGAAASNGARGGPLGGPKWSDAKVAVVDVHMRRPQDAGHARRALQWRGEASAEHAHIVRERTHAPTLAGERCVQQIEAARIGRGVRRRRALDAQSIARII